MLAIQARLVQIGEGVFLRLGAFAEAFDLREDEPHPVGLLLAFANFLQRLFVGSAVLRLDEMVERIGACHQSRGSCPQFIRL